MQTKLLGIYAARRLGGHRDAQTVEHARIRRQSEDIAKSILVDRVEFEKVLCLPVPLDPTESRPLPRLCLESFAKRSTEMYTFGWHCRWR